MRTASSRASAENLVARFMRSFSQELKAGKLRLANISTYWKYDFVEAHISFARVGIV
jgi:hypothetical protein